MMHTVRRSLLSFLCGAFLLAPCLRAEGTEPVVTSINGVRIDTLLYEARQNNDFSRIRSVLEGSPGSIKTSAGRQLFLGVCMSGSLQGIALLLDMGADPNASSVMAMPGLLWKGDALSAAVESRQVEAVTYLLSRGARPSVEAYNAAVRTGQRALAGELKSKGAAPYSEEIVRAAEKGDVSEIKALLKKGADASAMNWTGDTPLAAAAAMGKADAVRLLIENGARTSAQDFKARTAHDRAVEAGRDDVAGLLEKVGRDSLGFLNRAALTEAVMKKDAAQAARLLQLLEDPDLVYTGWEDTDKLFNGRPPRLVDVACGLGSMEIVKAFIAKGADVVTDAHGLFYAAGAGRLDVVALLLDAGSANTATDASTVIRLLDYAVGTGDTALLDLIVSKAGESIAASPKGMEALINAAAFTDSAGSGSRKARDLLAARGVLDATQDQKNAALRSALGAGDFAWVRSLLARGAEPKSGGTGWAPLALAIQTGAPLELIKELLSRGADVNDRGSETSALYVAAWRQRQDVVKLLLDSGADPNLPEPGGYTPLMESLRGPHEIVQMLLAAGADPDAVCTDTLNSTALMRAAMEGDMDVISLLLSKTPRAAPENAQGFTAIDFIMSAGMWNAEIAGGLKKSYDAGPLRDQKADLRVRLILALMTGDLDAASALVSKGAEIDAAGVMGGTLLMGFAANGDAAAVRFLLSHGADPLKTDPDGKAAVAHAAANGHLDLVKLLLPSKAADRKQGERALAAAAAGGRTAAIEYLLNQGYPAGSTDQQGSPALMLAARSGEPKAVQLLLKKGAAINAASPAFTWTNTPLACAAENGDAGMAKLLLGAGANAAVGDGDALIAAFLNLSNVDVARLILGRMTPAQKITACTRALNQAPYMSLEAKKLLLDNGARPDGAVLASVLRYHDREAVLLFLERGITTGGRDSEGYTPLRVALEQWGPDMVDRLLAKGADPAGMFVPVGDWPPRDLPEETQAEER